MTAQFVISDQVQPAEVATDSAFGGLEGKPGSLPDAE